MHIRRTFYIGGRTEQRLDKGKCGEFSPRKVMQSASKLFSRPSREREKSIWGFRGGRGQNLNGLSLVHNDG